MDTVSSHEINTFKLAAYLREKRGERGLREIAKEIGEVSASTLSRIEQGKIPDLDTYIRICRWMQVTPNEFVKGEDSSLLNPEATDTLSIPDKIAIHLRADRTLPSKTADALISMIRLAYTASQRGELKAE